MLVLQLTPSPQQSACLFRVLMLSQANHKSCCKKNKIKQTPRDTATPPTPSLIIVTKSRRQCTSQPVYKFNQPEPCVLKAGFEGLEECGATICLCYRRGSKGITWCSCQKARVVKSSSADVAVLWSGITAAGAETSEHLCLKRKKSQGKDRKYSKEMIPQTQQLTARTNWTRLCNFIYFYQNQASD